MENTPVTSTTPAGGRTSHASLLLGWLIALLMMVTLGWLFYQTQQLQQNMQIQQHQFRTTTVAQQKNLQLLHETLENC